MGKATERPVPPDAVVGRFQVAIDEDTEPVDWDCAVARFLLAVTARAPSASAVVPANQPSAAIPLAALDEHPGLETRPDSCIALGF